MCYMPDLRGKVFFKNSDSSERIIIVGTSPTHRHYQMYDYRDYQIVGKLKQIPLDTLFSDYTALKPSHVITYLNVRTKDDSDDTNVVITINPYDIPKAPEIPVLVINLVKGLNYLLLENSDVLTQFKDLKNVDVDLLKPLPEYAINEFVTTAQIPIKCFAEADYPFVFPGLWYTDINKRTDKSYAYLFNPTGVSDDIKDVILERLNKIYLLELGITEQFLNLLNMHDILIYLGLENIIYKYLNVYDIQSLYKEDVESKKCNGILDSAFIKSNLKSLEDFKYSVLKIKSIEPRFEYRVEVPPNVYMFLNWLHMLSYPGSNPIQQGTLEFRVLNHWNWINKTRDLTSNNINIYFRSTNEILSVSYETADYQNPALSAEELQTFLRCKK